MFGSIILSFLIDHVRCGESSSPIPLLELSLKGTYVTYPYLEYHYDRVLGRHTLLRYYITGNEFLRTGIYVEK